MQARKQSAVQPSFFTRTLFTMVGLAVVISIILSVLLVHHFHVISVQKMEQFELESLEQLETHVTYTNHSTHFFAALLFRDPLVKQVLTQDPYQVDMNAINLTWPNSPELEQMIDSVYFYNYTYQSVIVNQNGMIIVPQSTFPDQDIVQKLNKISSVPSGTPFIRESPTNGKEITYIFYEAVQSGTDSPTFAIIININPEWLNDKIAPSDSFHKCYHAVLDADGHYLIGSEGLNADEVTSIPALSTVLSAKNPGIANATIKSTRYSVVYQKSATGGLILMRLIPKSVIASEAAAPSWIVISYVAIILLIALILAFFFSRTLSRPVSTMASTIDRLQTQNQVNTKALKRDYLYGILTATRSVSHDVSKHFSDYQINVSETKPFFLILFQIDHWQQFCTTYAQSDRALLKYGIMNISEELLSDSYVCDFVNTAEDSMVAICNAPFSEENFSREEMEALIAKINDALSSYLDVSVSAIIGNTVNGVTELSKSYHYLCDRAKYRLIYGHASTFFVTDINPKEATEYEYPTAKERQLIESLMLGKSEKAKAIYQDMVDSLAPYPYATIRMTLLRLSFAICMSMSSQSLKDQMTVDVDTLSARIAEAETLDEIHQLYYELFDSIADVKSDSKNKRYDELLKNIYDILYTEYSDGNLSINTIAERVNMSPVYLGRLFKKLTGKSMNDTINLIRVEQAKTLLLGTDLTINEIVSQIGFSNSSYFYTIFKKYEGMAPNDFRQKSLKEGK